MLKRKRTTETTKDTSTEQNVEIEVNHTRSEVEHTGTGRVDETSQGTNLEEPHTDEGLETDGEGIRQ